MPHDFYQDIKFCQTCGVYVRYLRALELSYCVECGREVRLFSEHDANGFRSDLARERHDLGPDGDSDPGDRSGRRRDTA